MHLVSCTASTRHGDAHLLSHYQGVELGRSEDQGHPLRHIKIDASLRYTDCLKNKTMPLHVVQYLSIHSLAGESIGLFPPSSYCD